MAEELDARQAKTKIPTLDVVLLDDIARKLDDLLEIMRMQIPEGVVGPAIKQTVNSNKKKKIWLHSKGVRTFEVINDGDYTVYVLVNRDDGVPIEVKSGESLRLTSNFRVWTFIRAWTEEGESTIRVNYDY